jgi:hypothetical protein
MSGASFLAQKFYKGADRSINHPVKALSNDLAHISYQKYFN